MQEQEPSANPGVLKVCGKVGEVSRKKWTELLPCGQDSIFWEEGGGADNLEKNYFRSFSDKNAYIRQKSALESGRRLKICPPTIYQSRVKKSSLFLLAFTNDSVF